MNKNLLVGLGFFFAVIIIGFFLVGSAKPKARASLQISQSSSVPNVNKEIDVSAKEYSFTPSNITVNKGETVKIVFTNNGLFPHNFTISDLGLITGNINPGDSKTIIFTANKIGEFAYFCSIDGHKDLGMQGSLVVQ